MKQEINDWVEVKPKQGEINDWVEVHGDKQDSPKQTTAGRYATIAKQSFDKSLSGLFGMPGDINKWLNERLQNNVGSSSDLPIKNLLPTSDQIQETIFKSPVPEITPETTGENITAFLSSLMPDLFAAAKMPISQSPKLAKLGEHLYATGIKTPTKLTPLERANQVKTLIKERIPYNEKGAQKLIDIQDVIGKEIDNVVNAGSKDTVVRAGNIADSVQALKERYKDSLYKDEIFAAFDDITKRVVDVWGKGDPFTPIPPQKLHSLKKDLYKMNEKAYGKDLLEMTAREAGMKEASRTAKEGVETMIPGVKPLNKRYGDLADAKENLLKAAGREANKEPLSALDLLASGGSIGAGGIQNALAFRAARTATPRSYTAFALDNLSKSSMPDYIRNLLLLELSKGRPNYKGE